MTDTQDLLESSFELNLNNYGPEDVERLNDWAIKAYKALEAAQADLESTGEVILKLDAAKCNAEQERDQALARLAEIEGQEPIGCGYLIEYELGNTPSTYKKGHAFVTGVNVYAAAGASPVQPSQAGEPDASAKTWCEYVAGMVGCYLGEPVESDKCKAIAAIIFRRLWALPLQMPSQAGELSDAEILSAWGKHTLASDYNKYTLKEHVLRAGKEIIAAINANGVK